MLEDKVAMKTILRNNNYLVLFEQKVSLKFRIVSFPELHNKPKRLVNLQ